MKISNILAKKAPGVITIQPAKSVFEAIQTLTKHNIGALVVVNNLDNVVGIISERDIVRVFSERKDALTMPVIDVMTQRVVVSSPQDDVMAVVQTMTERRFRHLPVMDKDELVGIISIGDILKSQLDDFKGQIDTLEIQIIAGEQQDD